MWVFVNCLIENPTFDSQTKENMTLQVKSFGSKCVPSDKFIQGVVKSGIVEAVMMMAKFKQQQQLQSKCTSKKQTKLKGEYEIKVSIFINLILVQVFQNWRMPMMLDLAFHLTVLSS